MAIGIDYTSAIPHTDGSPTHDPGTNGGKLAYDYVAKVLYRHVSGTTWEAYPTGGGGGGHTIQDSGVDMTQRTNLNFTGAGVTVTDDAGNDATVVTISGGGGGGFQEDTYANWQAAATVGTLPVNTMIVITDKADLGMQLFVTPDAYNVGFKGMGGFLNADFQAVGDYSGVEAVTGIPAGAKLGIWTAADEGTYTTGDVVIWNLLHYQLIDAGFVDGDDPATNIGAYALLAKTEANVGYIEEWDQIEFDFTNDWIQYRQDKRGNQIRYEKAYDVEYQGYEYSLINDFQWGKDIVHQNFANNAAILAKNSRGNLKVNYFGQSSYIDNVQINAEGGVSFCHFETNSGITGGSISGNIERCFFFPTSFINNVNIGAAAYIRQCTFFPNAVLQYCTIADNAIIENSEFGPGSVFESNTINDGGLYSGNKLYGTFSGNTISGTFRENEISKAATVSGNTLDAGSDVYRNKINEGALFQNNTIGESALVYENVLFPESNIISNSLASTAVIRQNILYPLAGITSVDIGVGSSVLQNTIGVQGYISSSTIGAGSSIQACDFGTGAGITTTTMGDGANIFNNELKTNSNFSGVTLNDGASLGESVFENSNIALTMESSSSLSKCFIKNASYFNPTIASGETLLSLNIEVDSNWTGITLTGIQGKSSTLNASNFEATIDITGLTTLDFLAGNGHVGIFNITSSNATESIDTCANIPSKFDIMIRPSAGLLLTIVGTNYISASGGHIALTTVDLKLDGDNGDFAIFKPINNGDFLVEVSRSDLF